MPSTPSVHKTHNGNSNSIGSSYLASPGGSVVSAPQSGGHQGGGSAGDHFGVAAQHSYDGRDYGGGRYAGFLSLSSLVLLANKRLPSLSSLWSSSNWPVACVDTYLPPSLSPSCNIAIAIAIADEPHHLHRMMPDGTFRSFITPLS